MAEQIKEYTARRGLAKGCITRLVKFADAITDKTTTVEISTRLELLEKAFADLVMCEEQLVKFDVPSELPDYEPKYLNVKTKFKERIAIPIQQEEASHMEKLMSRILREQNEFLTTLSAGFTSSLNQTINQSVDEPYIFARLPKLNVPTFSGDYKEFPSFKDMYVASVHGKLGLNDVEKFQYLKGFLRGDAADLVRHITVSESNYKSAWEKLCSRYDKKRHVINDFIRTFVEQPIVKVESVTALRKLHSTSDEVMRGIAALGEEATGKDPWLIYILMQKLDQETRQAWAHYSVGKQFPTFEEFLTFISGRCDALETCEPRTATTIKQTTAKIHQINMEGQATNQESCLYCNIKGHRIYWCESFRNLSVEERRSHAASLNLCFNCLSNNHIASQCYSRRRCIKCRSKHHSLLHIEMKSISTGAQQEKGTANIVTDEANHDRNENTESIKSNFCGVGSTLLPTAVVHAKTEAGQYLTCNLLLDSGSQLSFITEKCVNRLGIHRQDGRVQIEGIATSTKSTLGKTTLEICSRFDKSKSLTINAYILPKITTITATHELNPKQIENLNVHLADPKFQHNKTIDILLGADYFFYVLGSMQHVLPSVIAQETLFGYVISRKPSNEVNEESKLQPYKNFNVSVSNDENLEYWLHKFWEQEEVVESAPWSEEDKLCEEHFKSNYKKENGRFIVQLPIKPNPSSIGRSYNTALQRLTSMERKRNRNPKFNKLYVDFMREYEDLGHMRKLTSDEIVDHEKDVFYLPHHGIFRSDSVTTKLRVVFDGSAASSNGTSLNDILMVGPSLQDTLWTILLRFRTFKVAMCGDIEKMYRQILVNPRNTSLQRIIWRESTAEQISHFELLTVTYGTASAPFLAIRALIQIANDCEGSFPDVARVIRENFYVDDVLTGANTEIEAFKLKTELSRVLSESGLVLRKWRSTSKCLSERNDESQIIDNSHKSNLLGLFWNPEQDMFSFKVADVTHHAHTKRSILAVASQIFDPMGWLSPFTVNSKIFLQRLWLHKVSWDEPLSSDLQDSWQQIQNQFEHLKNISVPRFTGNLKENIELHGFSDASELAYSAAVYIRTQVNDSVFVYLVTAKSKVAPIKQVSLPRLELCGAHLLAKLMKQIIDAYHLTRASVWLWIDSTVVLSWLSSHPRRWKTYVANRVSAIHQLVPSAIWRHVKGTDNPADLATRGITASKLVDSQVWWKGPLWLSQPEHQWPATHSKLFETLQEMKKLDAVSCNTVVSQVAKHPAVELWNRISSWSKTVRTMSYVQRFVQPKGNSQLGTKLNHYISTLELQQSELTIIKVVQATEMSADIHSLKKYSRVGSSSRIGSLAPFIDAQGILRVGGRLQNAHCSYEMKHPIILPRKHPVSIMILRYLHHKFLHAGPSLLLALSRHKYWVLGAREACRSICHKCVTCFRYSTLKTQQQMGILPEPRVTPSRPFAVVGVDYAGPIMLASKKGRGSKLIKGFLVIFVCFATKALHLEVASELTTSAFLAALDRFVSRRGAPTEIHSDNGTNFRGAQRKLQEHHQLLLSTECQSTINLFTVGKGIRWKFIPPISPHFGGIWERAVRSVKSHLIKLTGNAHLTFEEMTTVMIQIEGILNSRPLCVIRNENVDNIDPLTPSHFLTLGPITALPHGNYQEIKMSRLDRWERVQKIVQQFWKDYSLNYLNTLQQRNKWQQQKSNLQINDIVLLHDSKAPPCSWPLGRVIDVHTGTDGVVRVATVQSKSTTFKRPITKLFKLPLDD